MKDKLSKKSRRLCSSDSGFTFVEVMVALAVLSLGIVIIFKGFIVSLDRLSYLTNRLYATTLLDNRITAIERMLRVYETLPFDLNRKENINVGAKEIEFRQRMSISEVDDFADVFELDLSLLWDSGEKEMILSRSAYISDFEYFE
ncbi:MAG: prepilin-type N-terminal cleavage/methylation domain-containing protein [Candidatus Omnitrophica bacterium]|nr:prepilin-type N-terminal cleavage/methylation domain-containing protein [Candidatus Omnitrophota bacterium]